MGHYVLELAIWIFLAYFVGCVIGWLLHSLFGRRQPDPAAPEPVAVMPPAVAEVKPAPAPVVAPVPVIEPQPVVEPQPVADLPVVAEPAQVIATVEPVAEPGAAPTESAPRMDRPKGLPGPRDGKPDNLQRISGIGPKNERVLHNLGFFHFDQIAAWTDEQVRWVDDHLRFNGRIGREQWIRQARLLASGEEAEFMRLFGANQPRR